MSEDFEAGLRDLHDDAARAHARGAGFPTTALVGRARRIRRVRASATATLAMAAVAAVAVVGLQLADRPPSTPPAGTDGAPFISTTRCGDPAPVVEYRSSGPLGTVSSTGDLYLQLGPIAPVPVGSALSVKAELVNGTGEPQSWSDAAGPARYLVAQDDVVVATGEFGPARSVSLWRGEILAWGVDDIELVSCGGDRAGEPLPAGFYALFVVYPFVLDDGREIELAVGSGFGITDGPHDGATQRSYEGPACGSVIGDVLVFDEPPLEIELTLDQVVADPVEPLSGRVVVAVPGEFDFRAEFDDVLEGLNYTAVRDGVVVGYGRSDLIEGTWQTLSGRQGVTAMATIPLRPCDEDTSAWPPGDYELFASMPATIAEGEDEEPESRTILDGPWPFTVMDTRWGPVEITAVPVELPGADQRLLRVEAHVDGLRWRVTVEVDYCRDMYERSRAALVDDGYDVVTEDSDPARPFWFRGVFLGVDHDVELEASNETGGGCFLDYLITAH